jgi:chemotaxis protein MotA
MVQIVGILVVLGGIIGGYLLEHGNLIVLYQPAELVIIGGAAAGTLLIANPISRLRHMAKDILRVFRPSPYTKAFFLDALQSLYGVLTYVRKADPAKIEVAVDTPNESEMFQKYPKLLKDHLALHFLCDTLRTAAGGDVGAMEIDQMMEADLEVHEREAGTPATALATVAEALPGLGIVAAVLGIIITMGALNGPPDQIGQKVAAALVGTFLGILMCYGFLGPIAANLHSLAEEDSQYYQIYRIALNAYVRGLAPIHAVEMARRSIPHEVRPTFSEMEAALKGGGANAEAPEQKAA